MKFRSMLSVFLEDLIVAMVGILVFIYWLSDKS